MERQMTSQHLGLTELRLGNFKSFRTSQRIPLRPLTLIYGPNSSGKSALLQSLLLCAQNVPLSRNRKITSSPDLVFDGQLVRLGGFPSAVADHARDSSMELGFSFRQPHDIHSSDSRDTYEELHQDCLISWNGQSQSAIVQELKYSRNDRAEGTAVFTTSSNSSPGLFLRQDQGAAEISHAISERVKKFHHRRLEQVKQSGQDFAPRDDESLTTEAVLQQLCSIPHDYAGMFPTLSFSQITGNYDDLVLRHWVNMLQSRLIDVHETLHRIDYIGPLRDKPQRIYSLKGRSHGFVGSTGSNAPEMLLTRANEAVVNHWFTKMHIPYEISVKAAVADDMDLAGDVVILTLTDRRTGVQVALPDVGFGISQILAPVLQLATSENRIIVVEQPELHLHPKLQADFADLLIEAVADMASTPNGRSNQAIVETHSEHLLLRIQRRIRSGDLDAERINVIYVNNVSAEGAISYVLQLDESGEFQSPWPHGFFPERLDELLGD